MQSLRRRAGTVLLDNVLRGLSSVGRIHPMASPKQHGLERLRDVPYQETGMREHRLDVYRPLTRDKPLPVVLYLHGGGFRILSKDTHWMMGLGFARCGYVVFNANYRLAPKHPFPAGLQDALAAYHWVVQHAAEYGGDPERIIVAGESAGANLSLAVTLSACQKRPEAWAQPTYELGAVPVACLPSCGILQVSEPGRFEDQQPPLRPFVLDRIHEVTNAYLGSRTATPQEASALADPLLIMESRAVFDRRFPPVWVTVGSQDPIVPDTMRLWAALENRGVPHEARVYPGEPHAFQAIPWRAQAKAWWQDTHDFLARRVPAFESSPSTTD